MLRRTQHLQTLTTQLRRFPVVAIIGARQVGKTTLARCLADTHDGPVTRFDLEDPDDLARLQEPKLALAGLQGLVILDEIQRRPELFPILRVLVDRPENRARFLILGSASPELSRQGAETLAGRISYHELGGFDVEEVGLDAADALWLRGGFPPAFLADSEAASIVWREAFIRTFLERDIPQLGIRIPSDALRRFWQMLAHYHGQLFNGTELARAFGVSAATVRRYLDILTGALVIKQLQPWHVNISKRQVRSPKVYLSDTGLLHTLLGIDRRKDLEGHPKVGASWESFVLRELVIRLGVSRQQCYFWATHAGADLDLLVIHGQRKLGFEIKRTSAPRSTRSMHAAMESLGLERLDVIHAGTESFPLTDNVRAVAFSRMDQDIEPL